MFKVNKKDTSKTTINCSSILVNKFEQMLHFVLVFLYTIYSLLHNYFCMLAALFEVENK